jgi:hypothetical protein
MDTHERRAWHHKLAPAGHPARPSALGEPTQAFDGCPNTADQTLRRLRPIERDKDPCFVEIGNGLPGVTGDHRQRA